MTRSITLFILVALMALRVAGAAAYGTVMRLRGSHKYLPQATQLHQASTSKATHLPLGPLLTAAPMQGTPPTLSVFPNPAHGQTTVQIGGVTNLAYQLRLSNVLGGEVRRMPLHSDNQPLDGVALDLTNLPPGLYFCSLLANDKTLVTKRLTIL